MAEDKYSLQRENEVMPRWIRAHVESILDEHGLDGVSSLWPIAVDLHRVISDNRKFSREVHIRQMEKNLSPEVAANYTIQLARPRKYRLKATLDMLLDALGVKHINAWTPEEIENLDDKAARTYLEKLSIHTVDISNPEQRKAVVDKITAGAVTHAKAAGRQVMHDTANLNMVRDRQTGKIVSQPDFDSAPGLTNEQTRRMYKVTEEDFDASAGQDGGVVLGWARVLVGEDNCAFCAMLASRGPVYKRETVVKSKDGRRYHRHCDCKAVLVVKGKPWEGEQEYKRLKDLWQRTNEEEPGTYVDGRNGEEKTEDQIKHFMRLVSEDRTEHQRTEDGDAGLDEIKKSINKLNKVAKESHTNWVEAEQSKGVNLGARAAFVEPWAMALPEERTLGTEHWGDDPAIRYKRRFADKPDPKDRKQPSADLLRKLGYVEADVSKKERVDEYSRLVQKKLDEKIISSDNYDKWFDKESLVVAWLIERGAKEVLVLKEHSSLSDENKKLATELYGEHSPDFLVDGVPVEIKKLTTVEPGRIRKAVKEKINQASIFIYDARGLEISKLDKLASALRGLDSDLGESLRRLVILTDLGTIEF